jgi:GH15 family glucan-1,4-alpha-glucosidase
MSDLAVVGNCTVASLVDIRGRHVWFCFPRIDGDPVFCGLLDGETPASGFMDVEIANPAGTKQSYRRNTPVLETELASRAGAGLRITDFAPRFKRFGRTFRPPMLIRRIEPIHGRPRVRVRARPRFDYGAISPECRTGSNHARFLSSEGALRITTDMPVSYLTEEVEFVLDQPIHLILAPDETVQEAVDRISRDFLEETVWYWQDWVRSLSVPFEWQEAVIRAAITLKMCNFEETGAVVAALTTSIPEAPNTRRNWDYRLCWMRDAYFTVRALNGLAATRTMERYVRYLLDAVLVSGDSDVMPVYPIVPGTPLAEREIPNLSGYRGMGPVRVGNAASLQRQNDVYGSVILGAAQMFYDARLPQSADIELYEQLRTVAEKAEAAAFTPDAGLWEFRGREETHTYSAAVCWAGLHRMAKLAERLDLGQETERWRQSAASIREKLLRDAWRPSLGAFSASLEHESLDASLLLLPELGILPATDPRFLGTLNAIERDLVRDGFLLRYSREDDFGAPETAFVVCLFWYIDALAAAGRQEQARELFDAVLSRRNHVGLLSEDIDTKSGQLWGNFPQTYSLVGLILSAMRLSRSWEEGLWGV